MKRIICSGLSAAIMLVMLIQTLSAGVVAPIRNDKEYEPNAIVVFLKQKYEKNSCTVSDFPELELERVESGTKWEGTRKGIVTLWLAADSKLPTGEAAKRVAGNPMVESVFLLPTEPSGYPAFVLAGDADFSCSLNAKDISIMMEYILNGEVLFNPSDYMYNYYGRQFADANGDGVINAKDITEVMKFILGEVFY